MTASGTTVCASCAKNPSTVPRSVFSIKLKHWNRFSAAKILGKKDSILITNLLEEAGGTLGIDFNMTKKFGISDEFPDCTVTLSFAFHFDERQARKRAKGKENSPWPEKQNTAATRTTSLELGRQALKRYKLVVGAYTARNLETHDGDFADPYLR